MEYKWGNQGVFPFVIFSVHQEQNIHVEEKSLPISIVVVGVSFILYAYTFHANGKFYTIFKNESKYILYDSENSSSLTKSSGAPQEHHISTVWYIPKK